MTTQGTFRGECGQNWRKEKQMKLIQARDDGGLRWVTVVGMEMCENLTTI